MNEQDGQLIPRRSDLLPAAARLLFDALAAHWYDEGTPTTE